jgi:hypothetical protein
MLGGAQLTAPAQPSDRRYPGSVRQVRLYLARSRWQWPTLAWGIIVLESNSLPMTLRTVDPDGSKITYRSRATNLLLRERRRWYPERVVPAVPPDVALSDATLAVWLAGSLADDALAVRGAPPDPRRPLRLTAPALSSLAAAHLATQVRKHDWRCPVRPVPGTHDAEFSLNIEPCDRPDVEQWLEERVPRQAWQAVGSDQEDPEDLPDDAWDYTPPRGKRTARPRA